MPASNSRWNPYGVRRCVRLEAATSDGIIAFKTKSFTSPSGEVTYHPVVDVLTGAVLCDCPHFTYRLAKHNPTCQTPDLLCKHLRRAVGNLRRRGALH